MADMKANMLLTMSSVILTLSLPQVLNHHNLWPLYILITTCLITISLAAYTAMPKLPQVTKKAPDMQNPRFDILFFGDFSRLSYEQFEGAMEEILSDPSRAYSAQVHEIYLLGTFLAKRKYRTLRLGYISFITGLFATFVSFIIAVFLQSVPL